MRFIRRLLRSLAPRRRREPAPEKPPWAYPDAARMLVYFATDDFQILIWVGLEHHWRMLPNLTSRHHLFIKNPWHATEHSFRFSRRCLEHLSPAFPMGNVTWLGNTEEEVTAAQQEGWKAIFVNGNCWLDERIFKSEQSAEKDRLYDLVINSRPEKMKRPHLASEIDRLAVIRGICWEPDDCYDLRQLKPLYMNEDRLAPQQVAAVLNQSVCGGAFSEEEGYCQASSEYLLCGLPVVSTPSRGGRDVWYDAHNSVICDPTSSAVRQAVREIKAGLETGRFDRMQIREEHLRRANAMRNRFNDSVQQIFKGYGVSSDADKHLQEMFTNYMYRTVPLPDAKRLLTMGGGAMSAQFETGLAAEKPALRALSRVGASWQHEDAASGIDSAAWLRRRLKHSDIALMSDWNPDDTGVFQPLHPSVVAWGNDPVHYLDPSEYLTRLSREYRELGIKLQACNVWMLTATARVLRERPACLDAVCLDLAGQRIVPPWLDSEEEGVKPYWGCTNHPLFRRLLIARARAGILSGANLLHLDDHLGTCNAVLKAGGCFCKHCTIGFRHWLKRKFTRHELAGRGIQKIDSFDYRPMVKGTRHASRLPSTADGAREEVPLHGEFLNFQREAAVNFVRELRGLAQRTARHPVPLGLNAHNLSPTQLATAHLGDFFANELEHFGQEETLPPMAYLLGTALSKPVFATGAAECWIRVLQRNDVTRVRRWIATAYAFGHYFMFAYKKWGFSQESGTQWYETPISTYEPFCRFITENAILFDDYEPLAQVGVFYDNAACRADHWGVREVCRELHGANISCALALAGDDWLRHELTAEELAQFEIVVIPADAVPTGSQAALLKRWKEEGNAICWSGIDELRRRVRPWLSTRNGEHIWTLPRRKPNEPGAPVVIHLLNQDYNNEADAMRVKNNVVLSIAEDLSEKLRIGKATLFSPYKDQRELVIARKESGSEVVIPDLDLWAILRLE